MSLVESVRGVLPPKYREFAKFLVVGGIAWIVDTGLFTLLSQTVLAHKILTCKIISMVVSTVVSYVFNRQWSFNTRGGRRMSHEAILFFVLNGIGMGINLVPLAISHYMIIRPGAFSAGTVTIADWVSANIIGTILGTAFRYWSYRRFVFPASTDRAAAISPQAEPSR